jgi:energy-converting hydrogenase Eha subunit F
MNLSIIPDSSKQHKKSWIFVLGLALLLLFKLPYYYNMEQLEWVPCPQPHEPNDAFTLRGRGEVKRVLHNYQEALEDLDIQISTM